MNETKVVEIALEAMDKKRQQLGVSGVGLVSLTIPGSGRHHQIVQEMGRFERDPDLLKYGTDDTGTNYGGMAAQKWAWSVATGTDSGADARPLKRGETEYAGSVVEDIGIYRVVASFSGGTPQQDAEIATVAIAELAYLLR